MPLFIKVFVYNYLLDRKRRGKGRNYWRIVSGLHRLDVYGAKSKKSAENSIAVEKNCARTAFFESPSFHSSNQFRTDQTTPKIFLCLFIKRPVLSSHPLGDTTSARFLTFFFSRDVQFRERARSAVRTDATN